MATSIPDLRAVCVVVAVLGLSLCAGEPPGTPPLTAGDEGEQALSAAPPPEPHAAAPPTQEPSADVSPVEEGADLPAAQEADCPGSATLAAAPDEADSPPAAFRCAVRLPDGPYDLTFGSAGSDAPTTRLAIEVEGGTLVLELAPRGPETLAATSAAIRWTGSHDGRVAEGAGALRSGRGGP
ncbi:MAG TPA: hypothetical protein VIN61_11485 [Gammaproteobacteria bacterium]